MKRRKSPDRALWNANLWRVPLLMCVAVLLLFVGTLLIDLAADAGQLSLPSWLSVGGMDDARAILGAILSAVSTVLALVVSVSLLVLSLAASQFGPRLLQRFIRDGIMQATIGLFLATFLQSLLTFVVTRQQGDTQFLPQLTLCTSVFLVVASFVLLIAYSHRVAQTVQAGNIVADIVEDIPRAIFRAAPRRVVDIGGGMLPPTPSIEELDRLAAQCLAEGSAVMARQSGYLQAIGHRPLVLAAERTDGVARLIVRPGQYVLKGEIIAYILPARRHDDLAAVIHEGVVIGPQRVLGQDLEFAIQQLVDICLRALSSAINDTYTGLTCIDWLGDALLEMACLPPSSGDWRTSAGQVRLIEPPLCFCRVVKAAFDMIRQAGVGNPAVSIRLMQTCARLGPQLKHAEQRQALLEQVEALWEAVCGAAVVRSDRRDMEVVYRHALKLLGADAPAATAPS